VVVAVAAALMVHGGSVVVLPLHRDLIITLRLVSALS